MHAPPPLHSPTTMHTSRHRGLYLPATMHACLVPLAVALSAAVAVALTMPVSALAPQGHLCRPTLVLCRLPVRTSLLLSHLEHVSRNCMQVLRGGLVGGASWVTELHAGTWGGAWEGRAWVMELHGGGPSPPPFLTPPLLPLALRCGHHWTEPGRPQPPFLPAAPAPAARTKATYRRHKTSPGHTSRGSRGKGGRGSSGGIQYLDVHRFPALCGNQPPCSCAFCQVCCTHGSDHATASA